MSTASRCSLSHHKASPHSAASLHSFILLPPPFYLLPSPFILFSLLFTLHSSLFSFLFSLFFLSGSRGILKGMDGKQGGRKKQRRVYEGEVRENSS